MSTPRVDALMAKWDDDGATRGPAFCELRDLARELERQASPAPTDWRDEAMKAAWPYIKDTPVAELFAAPAAPAPTATSQVHPNMALPSTPTTEE